MTTDQICQKLFLDKSSSQHEIRCFFSAHILLSLQKFFNVLNSMSKIALPRYSRVSYKKKWMDEKLVIDSVQTSHFPLWRGKTLSYHFQCSSGAM